MDGEINKQIQPEKEDVELITAFKAGDKSVFDILVLRYQDKVFRTCLRFLGDYEEANDTAQEVFVKVYCSLKRFRLESKFSTWLYKITTNLCRNKVSSLDFRRKRKTLSIDVPIETGDGNCPVEIKDESLSPVSEIDRKEKAKAIQKAIGSLPDDFKEIVILRDIEGLSYEEIAEVTRYNMGTVKSRLSRAREELRQKLKELI